MSSPTNQWPHGARAAIALTFDNMGEAADLNRNLWPSSQPIGSHYSVTSALPKFLSLARRYGIPATYFIESWNLGVYPEAIRGVAREGHEVAWHAWQHENWGVECADEGEERGNFERSFSAMGRFVLDAGGDGEEGKGRYEGFRPPGGTIHGQRTLRMGSEFGLGYISPAAEEAALVPLSNSGDKDGMKENDSIVILPFRWRGVDAYYYMDSFSKLREQKGEFGAEVQTPSTLVESFIRQIDEVCEKGGFLALLFHPFLNDEEERLRAMEQVLRHLRKRREEGAVWLARCKDVEGWIRENRPKCVGSDPGWDSSTWR